MIPVADAVDADALRLRHEFLTLPTLNTSPEACAQLLNLSRRRATQILESLVSEGFLARASDKQYVRSIDRGHQTRSMV